PPRRGGRGGRAGSWVADSPPPREWAARQVGRPRGEIWCTPEAGLITPEPLISTTLIVAWALLIIALERKFPYEPQPLFRREFWTDLVWFSPIFSVLMGWMAYKFAIPAIDHFTGWSTSRGIRDWPIWIQVVVSLVTHDLFIYTFHRSMHRNRFLWRIHQGPPPPPPRGWGGRPPGPWVADMNTRPAAPAPD